jgi:NhaA family Na+:H+ antiporter
MSDSNQTPSLFPPEAWKPLVDLRRVARRPLDRFLQIEAASGILLLAAAAVALLLANSPWSDDYLSFWKIPLGITFGSIQFDRSIEWFVNDGLMVIFFFVVGLEIKREMVRGELSELRRAALPFAAAFGGMLAPAVIYLFIALFIAEVPSVKSGWGVPMATDIAFAVGVLALLGKRVPAALRVLLLTVAVIDDLGAILVIALFYSSGLSMSGFFVAAIGFAGIVAMQRFGTRSKIAYIAPALLAWGGIYAAGVHPTIAGVIVGLMTPATSWLGPKGFIDTIKVDLDDLNKASLKTMSSHDIAATLKHLDSARREVLSPVDSLIESLHPWVAFVIMPIFALANAGVAVQGFSLESDASVAAIAIFVGLVVGKPIGILLLSWLTVKMKMATLPIGISTRHLLVLGVVAGIGFTMAIFIAQLAFEDEDLLAAAKIGVLSASGAAAILSLILGRFLLPTHIPIGAATSADEAETSTEK